MNAAARFAAAFAFRTEIRCSEIRLVFVFRRGPPGVVYLGGAKFARWVTGYRCPYPHFCSADTRVAGRRSRESSQRFFEATPLLISAKSRLYDSERRVPEKTVDAWAFCGIRDRIP